MTDRDRVAPSPDAPGLRAAAEDALDVDTLVVAMVEAVKRVAIQHGIRPTEFMDAAIAAANEVRAAQSKEPTE